MKLAPYFLFLIENLNDKYPRAAPIMIVSKVRRMAIALPGPIELMIKLKMIKELTKARTEFIAPEMCGNILPPKKLQAMPRKIIISARSTGIFLKKFMNPYRLNTGHPALWFVEIVNLQVASSAVTVKSSLDGVLSLVESQYISK